MSSTSSSEQTPQKRSATEILASRYRHLFVLPSTPFLLAYLAVAVYLLAALSKGAFAVTQFLLGLAVAVLAASAVASALRVADKKTIASFRRTLAVLIAGEALWLICAVVGAAYALVIGSTAPLTNAFLFGAFITAGFEFMVINGTFTDRPSLAAALAVFHPASTIVILRSQELAGGADPIAVISGVAAMAVIGAFTALLKRRKTSLGYDALSLFRSFMKTWAAGDPGDLEAIISDHSEETTAEAKIMKFSTEKGDYFVVLPGVHPGPFHPIGSYDLPGVISRAFNELGPTMTLHMPGGHERNLSTAVETQRYSEGLREFASKMASDKEAAIRGPIHSQIGKAQVSGTAFSEDLLLTISFAPYGSDDLNQDIEDALDNLAKESGADATVVDAHNSIEDQQLSPDLGDPGWKRLVGQVAQAEAKRLRIAYSHSKDFGFRAGGDLTENGIGLLMLEAGGRKSVLVLADSNNAVPRLRGEVNKALEPSGYELLEFCTSDSHNLAARGLTVDRGYEALGEATSVESIAQVVDKMAKAADARLLPASYGSGRVRTRVKVFGASSLEEFARITQASSKFARAYSKVAVATVGVLLVLSIVL